MSDRSGPRSPFDSERKHSRKAPLRNASCVGRKAVLARNQIARLGKNLPNARRTKRIATCGCQAIGVRLTAGSVAGSTRVDLFRKQNGRKFCLVEAGKNDGKHRGQRYGKDGAWQSPDRTPQRQGDEHHERAEVQFATDHARLPVCCPHRFARLSAAPPAANVVEIDANCASDSITGNITPMSEPK